MVTVPDEGLAAILRFVLRVVITLLTVRSFTMLVAFANQRSELVAPLIPVIESDDVFDPDNTPVVPVLFTTPAVKVLDGVMMVVASFKSSVPAITMLPPVDAEERLATTNVCSSLVKFTGVLPEPSVLTPQFEATFKLPLAFEYKIIDGVTVYPLLVVLQPLLLIFNL